MIVLFFSQLAFKIILLKMLLETCLSFSIQPIGKFSAGSLLQHPNSINPASYKSHSASKPFYTLKHRLQLYREDQEVRDHLLSRSTYSLGPPCQGKAQDPSPTCFSFSVQPTGKPSAGRLFQTPTPLTGPYKVQVSLCFQAFLSLTTSEEL